MSGPIFSAAITGRPFTSNGVVAPGPSGSALFNGESQVVGSIERWLEQLQLDEISATAMESWKRSYGNMQSFFVSLPEPVGYECPSAVWPCDQRQGSALGCARVPILFQTLQVVPLHGPLLPMSLSTAVSQQMPSLITKTTPGAGWIRVVINDSKGTQDGRNPDSSGKTLTILDEFDNRNHPAKRVFS